MEWAVFLINFFIADIIITPVRCVRRRPPPILWDPYNPLFACDDPIIYATPNNNIPFVCPDKDMTLDPLQTSIYESAYLLNSDQEEDYLNCNATDHIQAVLQCDGSYTNNPLTLKIHQVGIDDFVFEAGKTYYVIGTTFRKQLNSTQLIGGSCNKTENSRQHKLRLKIHVCTAEEISNGTCRLCETEGCYYSKCGRNCSDQSEISRTQHGSTVSILKKRTCKNEFLDTIEEEYTTETEALCPSTVDPKDCGKNCSNWSEISRVQNGIKLTTLKKRTCTNIFLRESEDEYKREDETICSPSTQPKDCGKNCSNWTEISRVQNGIKLSTLKKRTCTNIFLQKSEEEYQKEDKTICSPSINPKDCGKNCTKWENVANYTGKSGCASLQKRSCENVYLGQTIEEFQEKQSFCSGFKPPYTAQSSKTDNNDTNTYKYLCIALSIVFLLLGSFIGALWHKKYHEKNCLRVHNIGLEDGVQYEKGSENPVFEN